jgi:hypothetical protein
MGLFNPASFAIPSSTSSASTPYSVPSSATSTSLLATNSARKGCTIWNNSTANLYIDFGATPTITTFAVKVSSGGYYELPFSYSGAINGIWDTANGNALVREFS